MHLVLALVTPVVVCSIAQWHNAGAGKPEANSPAQQYRDKEASLEENGAKGQFQ